MDPDRRRLLKASHEINRLCQNLLLSRCKLPPDLVNATGKSLVKATNAVKNLTQYVEQKCPETTTAFYVVEEPLSEPDSPTT